MNELKLDAADADNEWKLDAGNDFIGYDEDWVDHGIDPLPSSSQQTLTGALHSKPKVTYFTTASALFAGAGAGAGARDDRDVVSEEEESDDDEVPASPLRTTGYKSIFTTLDFELVTRTESTATLNASNERDCAFQQRLGKVSLESGKYRQQVEELTKTSVYNLETNEEEERQVSFEDALAAQKRQRAAAAAFVCLQNDILAKVQKIKAEKKGALEEQAAQAAHAAQEKAALQAELSQVKAYTHAATKALTVFATHTVLNVETGKDERAVFPFGKAVLQESRKRAREQEAVVKAAAFRAQTDAAIKRIKVERDGEKQKAARAEDEAEYQELETQTMQIFSGKQTLAIERLVQLAKDAGIDQMAIKAAAKVL